MRSGDGAEALDELRGLVMAVELVETAVGAALPRAVERCRAAGVDATLVAGVLGVSRATLYRKFLVARESVVAAEPVDAEGLGA